MYSQSWRGAVERAGADLLPAPGGGARCSWWRGAGCPAWTVWCPAAPRAGSSWACWRLWTGPSSERAPGRWRRSSPAAPPPQSPSPGCAVAASVALHTTYRLSAYCTTHTLVQIPVKIENNYYKEVIIVMKSLLKIIR